MSAQTAVLPPGWQERLVPLQNANTGTGRGLCLEVHDLAVAKLVAGREKDLSFVAALLRHRLADPSRIEARLRGTPLKADGLALALARLKALAPA